MENDALKKRFMCLFAVAVSCCDSLLFSIWVVMFASLCVWWIRTKVKACVHFVQSLLLFVNVFLFQSKCVKTVSDWYCLHVFFFQQWRYSRMLWGSRCATVALILLLWGVHRVVAGGGPPWFIQLVPRNREGRSAPNPNPLCPFCGMGKWLRPFDRFIYFTCECFASACTLFVAGWNGCVWVLIHLLNIRIVLPPSYRSTMWAAITQTLATNCTHASHALSRAHKH